MESKIDEIVKKLLGSINDLRQYRLNVLVAIDGRCASGKTTLAQALHEACGCNVLHTDDFYLRPEQRTAERLAAPGENIDHERFLTEVLLPLRRGETFFYRPYDCQTQQLVSPVLVQPRPVTIIEGSYCCHPKLRDLYDLRVFLSTLPEEQYTRITARNGEQAHIFREKWIPMEESYFSACHTAENCELTFDT